MYEMRFKGSKARKDFTRLLSGLSKNVKERIKNTLENNPYPTRSHGNSLNKVEQKGVLYCYPVSGGDRILYDIINTQNAKAVLIHYAGNDDGEQRYLKKYAK